MKLGNISNTAALLLIAFGATFNEEYCAVMDFINKDPNDAIQDFMDIPDKGFCLLTDKYQIQFVCPVFNEDRIHSISIFDRETGESLGKFRDLMPIVKMTAELLGLPVDEVMKIAKAHFN